jgi:hypothetical protein
MESLANGSGVSSSKAEQFIEAASRPGLIQASPPKEGTSMRFAFLLALALLFVPHAYAAKLESTDAAVAVTDQVMKRVASGDLRGGFELAKSYTVVPPAEVDAILGQAELQRPMLVARFGKSIGYELIRNDAVGDSLSQIVYIQRFEKHAMVWRFVLYRGSDGWTINSFKYADDIASVF